MARAALAPVPLATLALLALLALAAPVRGESLIATRMVRAATVVAATDVAVVDAAIEGALTTPDQAVGLEAKVTLYAGRPVRAGDLGPPALVEHNALVALAYRAGGLTILAEGRALARAAAGESVRVMNLASRTTVSGRVGPDGVVRVGPEP